MRRAYYLKRLDRKEVPFEHVEKLSPRKLSVVTFDLNAFLYYLTGSQRSQCNKVLSMSTNYPKDRFNVVQCKHGKQVTIAKPNIVKKCINK